MTQNVEENNKNERYSVTSFAISLIYLRWVMPEDNPDPRELRGAFHVPPGGRVFAAEIRKPRAFYL